MLSSNNKHSTCFFAIVRFFSYTDNITMCIINFHYFLIVIEFESSERTCARVINCIATRRYDCRVLTQSSYFCFCTYYSQTHNILLLIEKKQLVTVHC